MKRNPSKMWKHLEKLIANCGMLMSDHSDDEGMGCLCEGCKKVGEHSWRECVCYKCEETECRCYVCNKRGLSKECKRSYFMFCKKEIEETIDSRAYEVSIYNPESEETKGKRKRCDCMISISSREDRNVRYTILIEAKTQVSGISEINTEYSSLAGKERERVDNYMKGYIQLESTKRDLLYGKCLGGDDIDEMSGSIITRIVISKFPPIDKLSIGSKLKKCKKIVKCSKMFRSYPKFLPRHIRSQQKYEDLCDVQLTERKNFWINLFKEEEILGFSKNL